MPRNTKLTPEVHQRIVQFVGAGNYFVTACEMVGIREGTGREWLSRGRGNHNGRNGREPFASFATAIEKAEAEAETTSVLRIRKAAQGGEVVARKTTVTERKDGTVVTTTEETFTRPEWTADAWYLERKFYARWIRRDRHDVQITVEERRERLLQVAREEGMQEAEAVAFVEEFLRVEGAKR